MLAAIAMRTVGRIDSVWRYPVKSMRGEALAEAFLGSSGVYGDRIYAFHSERAPKEFPYLTAREQERMLLYRPFFRHPESGELMVDVETPSGEVLAIDDPRLLELLREGIREEHRPSLLRSERALTDCRPVSLFSIQTVRQLGRELETEIDPRRFRANLYLDLAEEGFGEDGFVGRSLRVGEKAVIAVVERDPRCKMITLDPGTAEANPEVIRQVARAHEGKAGVYGAMVVEGVVRPGDPVVLLD